MLCVPEVALEKGVVESLGKLWKERLLWMFFMACCWSGGALIFGLGVIESGYIAVVT
jgi:hypothetical protein